MTTPDEPQLSPRAQIKRGLRVAMRAFRYWPVMVIAATLAAAAAWVAPKLLPPVYSSETVLLYREVIEARSVVGQESSATGLGRNGGQRLREMLLSRTNLEAIVKELDLYPSTVAGLGMIEAINELRRNADCDVGRADSFTITYQGKDPEMVFRVTQRLANSLIEQSARYRAKQAESTQEFLQAQYERTQEDLHAKEQKLAVFLAQHPEFAQALAPGSIGNPRASIRPTQTPQPGGRRPSPPPTSSDPTVLALERQAIRIRQQLSAKAGDSAAPAPPPTVDPQQQQRIQRAQDELSRAQRQLREARASKTDSHPDVMSARARVRQAQTQVNALKASVVAPTPAPRINVVLSDADRRNLRAQLSTVEAALKDARGASKDGAPTPVKTTADGDRIVALETEWASLTRDVNASRERNGGLYRLLFSANIIATIESTADAAQMIVIDPPYKPNRPTKRGSRRIGALAALLTMLLGAAAALVLAFLDDRVYDAIDLESLRIGKLTHSIPAAGTARARKAKG